jgi:two-component sensor histidine kinase/streptogramin lyase
MQFILLAQDVSMEFRHLDKAKGLDQPFPFHIIQDRSGYIWIAGQNGLWRYSGTQFKHFHHIVGDSNSLSYDFIWRILEDSKGNIWAGTYGGGLSKYDPKTNSFTNYRYDENNPESISNNKIRGLEEDEEGYIWVGTNKGLNRLNVETGQFTRFTMDAGLSSMTLRDIVLSKDKKKLYIATADGLSILDLKTKKFKIIDSNLPEGYRLHYNYVYDVHEIDNSQLMIATGKGLHIMDLNTYRIRYIGHDKNGGKAPSSSVVFCITADPTDSNKLWLATMNGINTYNLKENKFRKINPSQKNINNIGGINIYTVLKDKDGGLWAGVNNAGVYHSHPSFNKFKTENFLNKEVEKYLNRYTGILRHNDNEMLITTYSGLIVWNTSTSERNLYKIPDPQNLDINRLTSITHYEKNKYLISVWGKFAYLWDHERKELRKLNKNNKFDNLIFNPIIRKDGKQRIWLGNRDKGLFLYDAELNHPIAFSVSDLTKINNGGDEYVKYIFEDSNKRLWVGTAAGLHLLNENKKVFKKYAPSKEKNSLSNGNINHISESKNGGLWISTELGLCYFDIEKNHFTRYFKEDGLPSNVISSALEDDKGNLWIATASGLARLQQNGEISIYSQSDGLIDEYFVPGSAYKDEKLGLAFGTSTEIVIVNPDEIVFNSRAPIISLEKLMINNELVSPRNRPDVLSKGLTEESQIILKQTDYLVNISFDALNLVNGHKNQYSIFLEGFDDGWRTPTTDRTISMSKLPPGNYKLYIRASNDEKVWSKAQAGLNIKVLPYWYESWWFRAISIFSVFLISGLVIHWRFNIVKTTNRKLENLVQNRTEEVIAQKEEIGRQNEKLKSRNNRIELLLRELNHRIKNNLQLVSSILNLHSRSTDNIDAKMALTEGKLRMQALSLLHQKLYMTEKYTEVNCNDYIKELLDYLSIAFKSNYSNVEFILDIDEFKLNLDQAVPLGLILNELVTNSLKHSGKEELIIELIAKKDADKITIAIKDNGKGITQEQFEQSSSFGISMIKSLIDQIDGELSIACKDGPHFKLEFISKEND